MNQDFDSAEFDREPMEGVSESNRMPSFDLLRGSTIIRTVYEESDDCLRR